MDCIYSVTAMITWVVLLTVTNGTVGQNKDQIHQEDAFCTNFTARLSVIGDEGFTITVTLGNSFWEAVRYFDVKDIRFHPILEGNGENLQLESLTCAQNANTCYKFYDFNDVIINPDINYDLIIDIGCQPPPRGSYPCDGHCEAFSGGVSFGGIGPTPGPPTTEKPEYSNEQIESWIFIVLGAVLLSIVVTVAFYLRHRYAKSSLHHNFDNFFSQVPEGDCDSRGTNKQLEILLIASSTEITEEIRKFLKLIREKECIKVTFHEENIHEIVQNENDWVERQFQNADFVLVVLSDDILNSSEFSGLIGKLLRRLESEAAIRRVNYAGVCFKKSGDIRVLNTLNMMKTTYRILDFPSIFYFFGILHNPLDNRLDYNISNLVKLMRNKRESSSDFPTEKHEESNILLSV